MKILIIIRCIQWRESDFDFHCTCINVMDEYKDIIGSDNDSIVTIGDLKDRLLSINLTILSLSHKTLQHLMP